MYPAEGHLEILHFMKSLAPYQDFQPESPPQVTIRYADVDKEIWGGAGAQGVLGGRGGSWAGAGGPGGAGAVWRVLGGA
jgi:hypothetical protein